MKDLQLHTNEKKMEFAAQLGYACELLYSCPRRSFPISAIEYWIAPAIALGQIQFFFDVRGKPVAYLTWAFLSDQVSARMERDAINVLHLSEWNEGLNLWVLDLVAPYGHAGLVCRHIRGEMFEYATLVRGVKRSGDEEMVRVRKFRRLRSTVLGKGR